MPLLQHQLVVQGLVESKPIRNLLIKRKAAKTAKSRAIIDVNLQNKINELGLTGALVAPTQQQENK